MRAGKPSIHNNSKVLERKNISRIFLAASLSILLYILIAFKLFSVQIIQHDQYTQKYKQQSRKKITIFAPKGNIYDRKYRKLAENIGMNYAFGINTRNVSNKTGLAKRISSVTHKPYSDYLKSINSKDGFVWVANDLSEKERGEILNILTEQESLVAAFRLTPNRVYPQGRTASQIVGYINIDGEGLSGIEKEFGDRLTGQDGWEYIYKDAKQKRSFGTDLIKKQPVAGNSVVLTIDDTFQAIAEDELARAVEKWKAQKGVVIIMEPRSGEILAMTSYPDFDPNKPGDHEAFARKHKAITDTYEPGSTFKTLTAAILFEENLVKEDDEFFCDNEGYLIGRRRINDSHENEVELMSFRDVIGQSSNIGTVKASELLDKEKHYAYLRDFGFGNRTDIELTGEVKGVLPKLRSWSLTTQPTLSFGQGISVTPLQLVTAYCAIANGGDLVKPMIVKGIIDKDNKIVEKYDSQVIRKVISKKTAERTRGLLRYVVENGTGSSAEIEVLKPGGKTGTSQKVIDGRYSGRFYDASFIGMVPYDDPALVCLVMLDSPRGSIYGGTVAAPVFRNIVKRIYDDNISNTFAERKNKCKASEVPDITGMKTSEAEDVLKSCGIKYKIIKGGDIVEYQSKKPFTLLPENDHLIISGERQEKQYDDILELTPSSVNLSTREAVKLLHSLGIGTVVVGRGNVFRQSEIVTDNISGAKTCSLFAKLPDEDLFKKSTAGLRR
jgi:cell division protein FtsI/penicillin-binding protein 2